MRTDPTLVNRCLGLALGMGALLGLLLIHSAYVWAHPVRPLFFISDGKGFVRPLTPVYTPALEIPNVDIDDTELLQWTVQAVLAPYNVDYSNYAKELNTASRKFTARGWNRFAGSYLGQGNFDELKRARLLCLAQSRGDAALIRQSKLIQGDLSFTLAYTIEVPVVQTCENVNQTSSNKLLITAVVVRTNADDHPDGLAIDQMDVTGQQ